MSGACCTVLEAALCVDGSGGGEIYCINIFQYLKAILREIVYEIHDTNRVSVDGRGRVREWQALGLRVPPSWWPDARPKTGEDCVL